jgi:porphobilinogen synthase
VLIRPRRNRRRPALRRLVRETHLTADDLVLPMFVQEGEGAATPIASMPGHARLSIDRLVEKAGEAVALGVPGVALFPVIDPAEKDPRGSACAKPDGLLQRSVRALKAALPELLVITDVALDPYSSDGHDGVLIGERIDNDETLPILAAMAVSQAEAGADIVAPSDMMDGRVLAIREALDARSTPRHSTARSATRSTPRRAAATRRPIRWTPAMRAKRCASSDSTSRRAPTG